MNPTKGLPAWGAAVIVVAVLALAWWLIPGGAKNTTVADQFPNDEFPSTYKPLPSQADLIRGATILTATDKEIAHGDVLMPDGKIKAVGREHRGAGGRGRHRRQRQVRHARHHRHPFASRRLSLAVQRSDLGRQRSDQADDTGSAQREFGVAAGPRLHAARSPAA